MEEGCSFEDDEGCQCGGHPTLKPPRASRGAFVGCSDWKTGDPPTYLGGHMSRWVPAGVDLDLLAAWLDGGVDDLEPGGSCTFIAAKNSREQECKRHGGEFPDLVRAGDGSCPVRVEFYTPRGSRGPAEEAIRAVIVMRGTHNHVYPVWKPSSAVVRRVVVENPSLSIRALQVRSPVCMISRLSGVDRQPSYAPVAVWWFTNDLSQRGSCVLID